MPTIHLEQWPTPIDARRGTILDAALNAGVPYPHACRSGECGRCKSMLHAGTIKRLPCDPEALSSEECDAGLVLACRSVPTSDVKLAWLAAENHAVQTRRTEVAALERVTHDITRLLLRVDGERLAFTAGQYATLKMASLPPRAYSMANHPDEPMLEFHIRHVPNGRASGYVANELKVGDCVTVEGPHGNAYLRHSPERPIVLAAGGSGLAPMLSILRVSLQWGKRQSIHLYHGVRDTLDLYAGEVLERLGAREFFSYVPVLSTPSAPTALRSGFLHAAIEADFPSLADHVVYTAGPPPMVDAVKSMARALGVGTNDIHADAFGVAAPEPSPSRGGLARVFGRLFGSR